MLSVRGEKMGKKKKDITDKELSEMFRRVTESPLSPQELSEASGKVMVSWEKMTESPNKIKQYLKRKFGDHYEAFNRLHKSIRRVVGDEEGFKIVGNIIIHAIFQDHLSSIGKGQEISLIELVAIPIIEYYRGHSAI